MLNLINSSWPMFCVTLGLMLLCSLIMSAQSVNFFTKDGILRRFSILELQLPATASEVVNLIKGIYKLPDTQQQKTLGSLRGQLYTDFFFMPFAYGSIMILCLQVSQKMTLSIGMNFFKVLAVLQVAAWVCDIIENIYLLNKIKKDVVASTVGVHKAYLRMECFKWGAALFGAICAISAICYFWLTGRYEKESLNYLLIILLEIMVFITASKIFIRKSVIQ